MDLIFIIIIITFPVFLFYLILKIFNYFTKKRTSYSKDFLNFKDWFDKNYSFDKTKNDNINNNVNFNEVTSNKYFVNSLPYTIKAQCHILNIYDIVDVHILKSQYRRMIHLYHPDKVFRDDHHKIKEFTNKLIEIKAAYDAIYEYLKLKNK